MATIRMWMSIPEAMKCLKDDVELKEIIGPYAYASIKKLEAQGHKIIYKVKEKCRDEIYVGERFSEVKDGSIE